MYMYVCIGKTNMEMYRGVSKAGHRLPFRSVCNYEVRSPAEWKNYGFSIVCSLARLHKKTLANRLLLKVLFLLLHSLKQCCICLIRWLHAAAAADRNQSKNNTTDQNYPNSLNTDTALCVSEP